jgi:hypothetical protein
MKNPVYDDKIIIFKNEGKYKNVVKIRGFIWNINPVGKFPRDEIGGYPSPTLAILKE